MAQGQGEPDLGRGNPTLEGGQPRSNKSHSFPQPVQSWVFAPSLIPLSGRQLPAFSSINGIEQLPRHRRQTSFSPTRWQRHTHPSANPKPRPVSDMLEIRLCCSDSQDESSLHLPVQSPEVCLSVNCLGRPPLAPAPLGLDLGRLGPRAIAMMTASSCRVSHQTCLLLSARMITYL